MIEFLSALACFALYGMCQMLQHNTMRKRNAADALIARVLWEPTQDSPEEQYQGSIDRHWRD